MEHIITIIGAVFSVCTLFSYWKRLGEREEECASPVDSNSNAWAEMNEVDEKNENFSSESSDSVAEDTGNTNTDSQQVNTKDLVIDTLKKIGCKPEEDDEGRLHFDYQEGHFVISCCDTSYWIRIEFLFWYDFSTYDIDQFSRMQKAVNVANSIGSCNVFYAVNKETDTVYLHSNWSLPFVAEIPDLDDYLREALKMLFASRYFVCHEIEKVESKEYE